MAKNDNLTDFLTDVADAIREKEGSSAPINPQDFAAKIRAIQGGGESGGGGASASAGAVNFRDYDGTILHSFSKDEFLALTEMPELPTQKGLTCQGWNYNIDDAKSYVQEYGVLDIGATYITDDGKTRFYVKVEGDRKTLPIKFSINMANSLVIDWGDGATESISGSSTQNVSHTYDKVGEYVISFEVAEGATLTIGTTSTSTSSHQTIEQPYSIMLNKVEFGKNIKLLNYAFNNCYSLSSVVLPNSVTSIGNYVFRYCYSLSSVVIPNGVTSFGKYAFGNCSSLLSVVLPNSVTSIGEYALSSCYSLSSVVLPNSVTSIGNYVFQYCYSLSSLVIPNSVTSIGRSAFNSCKCIAFINFRTHTSVPTLSATSAFSSIASDCKIIVPDALYDEWIAASNWSSYASMIVKASEFNG